MLYTINEDEIGNKNFIEIIKIIYKDYPDLIKYYEIIWENKQDFKNEIEAYLRTLIVLNKENFKNPMSKDEELKFINWLKNDFKIAISTGQNQIKEQNEARDEKKDLENLFNEL